MFLKILCIYLIVASSKLLVTMDHFRYLFIVLCLLGRAQPVIPPNLYIYEHNSLGSSGYALPIVSLDLIECIYCLNDLFY